MTPFTLNDSAIFSLHQLTKQVYWKTGFRCRLDSIANLLRLLRHASYCQQKAIQHWYLNFIKQLSLKQLKLLIRYGVKLPLSMVEKLVGVSQPAPTLFSRCTNYIKQRLLHLL